MNKAFWKDFYGWLETAPEKALYESRSKARQQALLIVDQDVLSSINRIIRLIDEELTVRALDFVQYKTK